MYFLVFDNGDAKYSNRISFISRHYQAKLTVDWAIQLFIGSRGVTAIGGKSNTERNQLLRNVFEDDGA